MSHWPIIHGPSYSVGLSTITTSRGTAITASGTANTKGTWSQIIASTADDYQALIISLKGATIGPGRGILDIGIGASTAEQVLIPDLRWGQGSSVIRTFAHAYFCPIGIATGTRVSGRAAASVASMVCHVQIIGIPRSMQYDPNFDQVNHYGIVTADSGGTGADCGATANTKGAWAILTSSTTEPIKMFYVIMISANTGTPAAGGDGVVDIGIGATGSEQIIIPDLPWCWATDASAVMSKPVVAGPFYCDIPSGTQIQARSAGSGTDATGRVIDVSVLAFV